MSIHCKLAILITVLTLENHVHSGKIVGGHEAVPHSRPYMVLLERHMSNGQIKYCGGFLLNEDFVMTAAHCQAKNYTISLGVHNIHGSNEIQRISVEQAFPHQHFNGTSFVNDVMLLKLTSKAKFSGNVKAIPLAGRIDGALPKSCLVPGWGRTDRNSKYISPKLMEVNVTLIDNEACFLENFYCSQGETGPAEGDSGGPLVCEDGKAFGVVSSAVTPHSGGPDIYRYSKIPDSRDWILWTMRNAMITM
ncbi:mast cell protease 1A-like [Archocentrus centrarchus]|uniref:mast cell protease 1A-like n=1 Tax=Archocentrus centrarchus TaxID=63155 RepID=UPI0011E9D4FA|nr:mast cell protease 1A-like [Archocentrus centrarchus]